MAMAARLTALRILALAPALLCACLAARAADEPPVPLGGATAVQVSVRCAGSLRPAIFEARIEAPNQLQAIIAAATALRAPPYTITAVKYNHAGVPLVRFYVGDKALTALALFPAGMREATPAPGKRPFHYKRSAEEIARFEQLLAPGEQLHGRCKDTRTPAAYRADAMQSHRKKDRDSDG